MIQNKWIIFKFSIYWYLLFYSFHLANRTYSGRNHPIGSEKIRQYRCHYSYSESWVCLNEWCHISKILEMQAHLPQEMLRLQRETRHPHPGDAIVHYWRCKVSFRDAHPSHPHPHSRERCGISCGRCSCISKILDMWHCWKKRTRKTQMVALFLCLGFLYNQGSRDNHIYSFVERTLLYQMNCDSKRIR